MWWVCDCLSKLVIRPTICIFRLGNFPESLQLRSIHEMCCSIHIYFLKGSNVLLMCSQRSEFAVTLVAFRAEDAFYDLIAHSILGAMSLSIEVKIAFPILSSTVSIILLVSLSTNSLKHQSKVFTFTVVSLVIKLLPERPTVNSWSPVPSMSVAFSCHSQCCQNYCFDQSHLICWQTFYLIDFHAIRNHVYFSSSIVLEIAISTTLQHCTEKLKRENTKRLKVWNKYWQPEWKLQSRVLFRRSRSCIWATVKVIIVLLRKEVFVVFGLGNRVTTPHSSANRFV